MIREIIEEDKEQVKKLLNNFPQEIQNNLISELEQTISKSVSGYVFIEEEKVRGYIVLRKWGGIYWLDTLSVDDNFQGRGIGKSLVNFAKEECVKEGILQLNTCTFYDQNLSFYQNLGFFSMGELDGPFMPLDKKRYYLRWRSC